MQPNAYKHLRSKLGICKALFPQVETSSPEDATVNIIRTTLRESMMDEQTDAVWKAESLTTSFEVSRSLSSHRVPPSRSDFMAWSTLDDDELFQAIVDIRNNQK